MFEYNTMDKIIRKVNIGLAPSRNYDKITLEVLEEPIEFTNEEEFKAKVRKIFSILREEVEIQFTQLYKKT